MSATADRAECRYAGPSWWVHRIGSAALVAFALFGLGCTVGTDLPQQGPSADDESPQTAACEGLGRVPLDPSEGEGLCAVCVPSGCEDASEAGECTPRWCVRWMRTGSTDETAENECRPGSWGCRPVGVPCADGARSCPAGSVRWHEEGACLPAGWVSGGWPDASVAYGSATEDPDWCWKGTSGRPETCDEPHDRSGRRCQAGQVPDIERFACQPAGLPTLGSSRSTHDGELWTPLRPPTWRSPAAQLSDMDAALELDAAALWTGGAAAKRCPAGSWADGDTCRHAGALGLPREGPAEAVPGDTAPAQDWSWCWSRSPKGVVVRPCTSTCGESSWPLDSSEATGCAADVVPAECPSSFVEADGGCAWPAKPSCVTGGGASVVVVDGQGGAEGATAKTITEALVKVPTGGTVRLMPGTYEEDLLITRAVTIEAACPGTARLLATGVGVSVFPPATPIAPGLPQTVTLTGLELVGGKIGLRAEGGSRVRGQSLRFLGQTVRSIQVDAKAEVRLARIVLGGPKEGGTKEGTHVWAAGALTLTRARLEGRRDGVVVDGKAASASLEQVRLRANSETSLRVSGGAKALASWLRIDGEPRTAVHVTQGAALRLEATHGHDALASAGSWLQVESAAHVDLRAVRLELRRSQLEPLGSGPRASFASVLGGGTRVEMAGVQVTWPKLDKPKGPALLAADGALVALHQSRLSEGPVPVVLALGGATRLHMHGTLVDRSRLDKDVGFRSDLPTDHVPLSGQGNFSVRLEQGARGLLAGCRLSRNNYAALSASGTGSKALLLGALVDRISSSCRGQGGGHDCYPVGAPHKRCLASGSWADEGGEVREVATHHVDELGHAAVATRSGSWEGLGVVVVRTEDRSGLPDRGPGGHSALCVGPQGEASLSYARLEGRFAADKHPSESTHDGGFRMVRSHSGEISLFGVAADHATEGLIHSGARLLAGIRIGHSHRGLELRGRRLKAGGGAAKAPDAHIYGLLVHDTSNNGVSFLGGVRAKVTASLLERTSRVGFDIVGARAEQRLSVCSEEELADSAQVELDRVVVRDNQVASYESGFNNQGGSALTAGDCGVVLATRSRLTRAHRAAVATSNGGKVIGYGLAIQQTLSDNVSLPWGAGAAVDSTLQLFGSRLVDNQVAGVLAGSWRSSLCLEGSTVDSTRPQQATSQFGIGIAAFGGARLDLVRSRLVRNRITGLFASDAHVRLAHVASLASKPGYFNAQAKVDNLLDEGAIIRQPRSLQIRRSLFAHGLRGLRVHFAEGSEGGRPEGVAYQSAEQVALSCSTFSENFYSLSSQHCPGWYERVASSSSSGLICEPAKRSLLIAAPPTSLLQLLSGGGGEEPESSKTYQPPAIGAGLHCDGRTPR